MFSQIGKDNSTKMLLTMALHTLPNYDAYNVYMDYDS